VLPEYKDFGYEIRDIKHSEAFVVVPTRGAPLPAQQCALMEAVADLWVAACNDLGFTEKGEFFGRS
jgi:hypothetical protein